MFEMSKFLTGVERELTPFNVITCKWQKHRGLSNGLFGCVLAVPGKGIEASVRAPAPIVSKGHLGALNTKFPHLPLRRGGNCGGL